MVSMSRSASGFKVGFIEICSSVMKKVLDERITDQHTVVRKAPHLKSGDFGLMFSLCKNTVLTSRNNPFYFLGSEYLCCKMVPSSGY